jgi:hypothetical protein
MQCVVLDKSYLQGATSHEVRSLCEDNVVLMIETLFYELLTADEEERAWCFRKLPGENPVALLPRPGPLIRYEIANGKAAHPLTEHTLKIPFTFNLDASLDDEEQRRHLADWETSIVKQQDDFPAMARMIRPWFDCDFLSMQETERRAECDMLKATVSEDHVRAVYRDNTGDDFPSHELLDPTWVLYRWFQARVIACLDFVARYGFSNSKFSQKKLENDLHDTEYLTLAPLAGGLATRDKLLASNFKLICPDGRIIS